MGTVQNTFEVEAKPEEVFKYIENIWNIKYHLSVIGIKLDLETLSENAIGIGATYHWYGQILGEDVDFTGVIVKRIKNQRIHYQSLSDKEYNIILRIKPTKKGTEIFFNLNYQIPTSWNKRERKMHFYDLYLKKVIDMIFESIKMRLEFKYKPIINQI